MHDLGAIGGECRNCGWFDPDYEEPELPPAPEPSEEDLAEPCVLTSDISTFITPDD